MERAQEELQGSRVTADASNIMARYTRTPKLSTNIQWATYPGEWQKQCRRRGCAQLSSRASRNVAQYRSYRGLGCNVCAYHWPKSHIPPQTTKGSCSTNILVSHRNPRLVATLLDGTISGFNTKGTYQHSPLELDFAQLTRGLRLGRSSAIMSTLITDQNVISSYNRGPITSLFTPPASCTATQSVAPQDGTGTAELFFGHFATFVDSACFPTPTPGAAIQKGGKSWDAYYCKCCNQPQKMGES